MKKVTPEVVNYFCDSCGIELVGTNKAGNYKINMTSDGLDYSGHAVGRGSGGNFDCCYECYSKILDSLRTTNE